MQPDRKTNQLDGEKAGKREISRALSIRPDISHANKATRFLRLGVVLGLGFALSASALTSNPYGAILDRNVFSLKAPPPVNTAPEVPPAPPVKLTLTGITTIFGNKRALLKAQLPGRPPEPAKEENYMLTEGQRDGGVEVISIDERGGIVKVNNNGMTETLDFVNNGAKAMASAPVVNTPGVIPSPSGMPALPGANGSGNPPMPRQIPGRSLNGSGNNQTGANAQVGGIGNGLANVPSQFQNITPEDQTILIEAQRLHLQDQGKHEDAAMFPITEMTPGVGSDQGEISPQ